MNKLNYFTSIIYGFLLIGAANFALAGEMAPSWQAPFSTGHGLIRTFENIINWIAIFVLIAAVMYIILAAYSYMTAAGNQDNIDKAKRYLTYAIIAIVLVLAAEGIVRAITSIMIGRQIIPG